ncbi:MAG: DUF1080 domain-containing protein [Bacteroidales bacterium]|jgi:hypothetical protein|nr:DUF1080 domain-containing protein [Bacteroidales bacterium]
MKKVILCVICCACIGTVSSGQAKKAKGAQALFAADLSNAGYNKDVWTVDKSGVLSASADDAIWTVQEYENFELTLEFKNDICTNSGVVIYSTNKKDWIPNSVEIQIADDHCAKWTNEKGYSRCAAVYGHLGPSKTGLVKKPGEWNKMKITARGQRIIVELNGKKVTDMDMSLWTSGKTNPDGSDIPSWLPRPFAELPTKGYIGFQGKHGDATIWFRNIRIKQL